jgi:hypothetical protein
MLDNEVKYILQEQFSQEKNYQKIINKNNKNTYAKIIKYAILPICAVALVAIIIMPNNKDDNYKGIAYVNNIEIEENSLNTIIEIADDNEIIENKITEEIPNEQIETGKNNESKDNKINETKKTTDDNSTTVQVAEKEIYTTIDHSGEASWAYDPKIPTNLINDHPTSKYIIKVKVTSVGEGEMLPKQENFYNPYTCYTPIKMQIIDNLSETNTLSGTITAYIDGGKIKISNLLTTISEDTARNLGILNLSKEDQEKYIEYIWTNPYYKPTIGNEYVIIINKANANLYQIMCGGYGIFKVDKSDGQEKYINVITNKEWKMQ